MTGNIKETFLPKTGMQKKQVLQDPGYVKGSDVHAACHIAWLYEISHVEGVERKNSHNVFHLRYLFIMLKESKVHSIYN